jgi:beta-glucosidase
MQSVGVAEPWPAHEGRTNCVNDNELTLPRDFLLGAATSAYQVEGAAHEDGRIPSIWDTFCRTAGKVRHGDTGDIACDHYHRLEEDLDLISSLGLRAYRFSIAWPRIMPDGNGHPNQKGLDFYRRLLNGLKSRGVVPMATLYHWDLPQTLQDKGGWLNRDTALRLAEYVSTVAAAFKEDVAFWVTINEPWCSAFAGHLEGRHAPGLTDLGSAVAAAHHLLLGHGLAVQALREAEVTGQVGIALNLSCVVPATSQADDVGAAARVDGYENRWFLDPLFKAGYPEDMVAWYGRQADLSAIRQDDFETIRAPIDFIGINYYERKVVSHGDGVNGAQRRAPEGPLTAGGLPVRPDGLLNILSRVHSEYTKLPVYVTENGAAFNDYVDPEGGVDDIERVAFLDGHLRSLQAATVAGIDVRGYFVWSLMDNFEWADGYGRRFGIVYVDFRTQARIPKASGIWISEVLKARATPKVR